MVRPDDYGLRKEPHYVVAVAKRGNHAEFGAGLCAACIGKSNGIDKFAPLVQRHGKSRIERIARPRGIYNRNQAGWHCRV